MLGSCISAASAASATAATEHRSTIERESRHTYQIFDIQGGGLFPRKRSRDTSRADESA